MNFNQYSNLVEATNDLTKRGFKSSFKFEDGKMTCLETEVKYTPQEMKIVELHRFEGYSNPADNSVIFAVECNDGKKGVIITSYGAGSGQAMDEFMQKVEVDSKGTKENLAKRTTRTSRK